MLLLTQTTSQVMKDLEVDVLQWHTILVLDAHSPEYFRAFLLQTLPAQS